MSDLSRRQMFLKIGVAFNAVVGVLLGIPIVGYLLSPLTRGRNGGYDRWIPLGSIDQFPAGQTRLATYRNPGADSTDGETAEMPCWVRHIDGNNFQVFAINCAHLGCPVRWFPQSRLFMCPCHGGVYYEDGSRASGPPERGLFEFPLQDRGRDRSHQGRRTADAWPFYGEPAAHPDKRSAAMRLIRGIGQWVDQRLQLGAAIRETMDHPDPARNGELVLRLRQRRHDGFRSATGHRNSSGARLRPFGERGVEQPADFESRRDPRLVYSRAARLGLEFHAGNCADPHGPGVSFRRLQISARVDVDLRRSACCCSRWEWPSPGRCCDSIRTRTGGWASARRFRAAYRFVGPVLVKLLLGGPIIAGATLSRFFALHVFVIPGLLIAFVGLHVLMVLKLGINEWPMPGRLVRRVGLHEEVPRDDAHQRRAVCPRTESGRMPCFPA